MKGLCSVIKRKKRQGVRNAPAVPGKGAAEWSLDSRGLCWGLRCLEMPGGVWGALGWAVGWWCEGGDFLPIPVEFGCLLWAVGCLFFLACSYLLVLEGEK